MAQPIAFRRAIEAARGLHHETHLSTADKDEIVTRARKRA
jgi:hypothetical protein